MVRVLVVDDEQAVRKIISSLVIGIGGEVEAAVDGGDAWEKIRQTPFDLVITDLKMPIMDGMELLRKIKEMWGETLVIILTGNASLETAIESLRLGAYDYIEKPFSLIDLEFTIKRALEKIGLIRELKVSIERLRKSNRELQAKREELRKTQERFIHNQKLDLFSKMASFMAHSLKSSISTLSLMLQNSARYMGNQTFLEESFKDISHEVKRIENLINSLQHMPRGIDLPYRPIDLNNLIQHCIDILYFDKLPHIAVIKDLRDIPPVNSHEELLRAAFCNIIKNSIEAMPNGGKLWISTKTITSHSKGPLIHIQIKDTGVGMLPCFIKYKLFKPFQTTKEKGLGLGLYHSREIIERHGGNLSVKSELNRGTNFTIRLPGASDNNDIPQCYFFR